MSKPLDIRQTPNEDLSAVAKNIATGIAQAGNALANKDLTEGFLSLESLSTDRYQEVNRTFGTVAADLKKWYEDAGISVENISDTQWRAGAAILMAAGDPVAYHTAARNTAAREKTGFVTVNHFGGGGFDMRHNVSAEAYDARELEKAIPFSVIANVGAARQDEFCETLFPTVIVTPDMAGLAISVSRVMVFNELRHDLTGKAADFHRRNLLEATIDASILTNDSTKCVPVYITGNAANNASFSAAVAASNTKQGNDTFLTAPLAFGRDIDIIGLSQPPAIQASGVLDQTDQLDQRLTLSKLYVQVTSTAGATTDVIPFDVSRSPRAQFLKSQEGYDREMVLAFQTNNLVLRGTSKNAAGAVSPTLSYLTGARASWFIRLKTAVPGDANLETGNIKAHATAVTIDSAWIDNGDNTVTQVTGADLTALQAEFATLSLVGWDARAYRSNLNRRNKGLQLTTVSQNELHVMPLGTPFTSTTPITATNSTTDLAAPITAVRIQASNAGVTKLLDYMDHLSSYVISTDRATPTPDVEGIGRLLVRPFFERKPLDVTAILNTIKSQDRSADVAAAIVNKIREVVYRAYRDSGYQAALDAISAGTGERPTVVIATDPVIAKYLVVPGDTRTLSIGFDSKVVTSTDTRVYGKIFLAFVRPGQTGPDPLSFGCMGYMPELATNVQMSRNGQMSQEAMVQARFLHINTCPIGMVFDVDNLGPAVADNVAINMHTV